MRWFHGAAQRTFVVTPTLGAELESRGIAPTHLWPLGVDLDQFNPSVPPHAELAGLPRPILLNVGRAAVEKNIEAFLDLEVAGSKVVVGGGPALEQLRARYPGVLFMGSKQGSELASTYTAADVFVFPSRTDTFGMVLLEAAASGLPVAAFPVTGPVDVVVPGETGVLSENLRQVVVLHYTGGLTLLETAEALGISPGTVKSRLSAALTKLRSILS